MKKVEGFLYEEGDHVLITAGSNKGMVGIVDFHEDIQDDVFYFIPELGNSPGNFDSCDYESPPKYLKFITKKEADKINATRKFLKVKTLEDSLIIKDNKLVVGCQTISAEDALTISKFIKDNMKVVKKTVKNVAKKKPTKRK